MTCGSKSKTPTTNSEIEEEEEVGVFIDTSLGTHIAISVSPHLTASQFIRKFESMHSYCYPQIGNIKVSGLMVKRKSCLYHLPESMPIKYVFQRSKGTWFLYAEANPLNNKDSLTPQSEVVRGELSENRTKNCRQASKNVTRKVLHCSLAEPTSERMSESISVSGIIKKYFSVNDDEVTSTNSKTQVPKYAPNTPPEMTDLRASRDHKKACGVGTRLVVAANNLGISTSDKKPVISLCKYKFDKSSMLKSPSLMRHPVFEIGEE